MPKTETVPADLAARYPRRRGVRRLLIGVVALLAALGLAWTIWAAWLGSHPAVAGRVKAFTVVSETQTDAILTVDRRSADTAWTCGLYAQSTNFEHVGEVQIQVPAGGPRIVDVPVTIKTFRRATSVSFDKCTAA